MDVRCAPAPDGLASVLTDDALAFVADLHRRFAPVRRDLLARRAERRVEIARTGRLDFLPETAGVRSGDWRVAPAPAPLTVRRAEITGPTERKMTINALNSGADVWLADFEDASAPTWNNVLAGQVNLTDALAGTIELATPERKYRLHEGPHPTIVVRPRGWHLDETRIHVDGQPVAGALVDFGLYLHRNRDAAPYFYLPKLESHREARLWNDVFVHAQQALDIPQGTIRATVLIETVTAAFEMDEILHELREHASGLNAGRWDYLFSLIKNFRDAGGSFVLPDRNAVTMTAPFMRSYTELLVATCHRRGAYAIGGMAAFIPNRRDPDATAVAVAKVRADKEREAGDGFDGSWVAHPDLVPLCRDVFGLAFAGRQNQLHLLRDDVKVTADDLLAVSETPGEATPDGLRNAVAVGLRYLDAWLGGRGAVAIFNLMEDVATAEISRSQVWQWVHNGVRLSDGTPVTDQLVRAILADEVADLTAAGADVARLERAAELFATVALADDFVEFLTLPASRHLEG